MPGRRTVAVLASVLTLLGLVSGTAAPAIAASAAASNTIGQDFVVSAADIQYILKQIQIAERHSRATVDGFDPNNAIPANPDPTGDPVYCQALLGSQSDQVGTPLLSFGLRTVDGSCNNLQPGQATNGAADQPFPRLTSPLFDRAAEDASVPGLGPVGPPGATNYNQTSGVVVDSEPRTISNLIVDQTSANPAAVAAAGFPVRSQGNPGVFPCTAPNTPVGCVPEHETLDIANVTTDVGLSPPFNSLFTIFGQFFDHGLDKITNGGSGAVMVPLKSDDPLIAGPDHILMDDPGTAVNEAADNLPVDQRFMVLTRGRIIPGADGLRNAPNTDTPFVDQSQTYTSHASHQVFVREYALDAGRPVATGMFLSNADGGEPTWAGIKAQAASRLGIKLTDADVGNIPMVLADPYGNFVPGPNGLPQLVMTDHRLIEGNLTTPVAIDVPECLPGDTDPVTCAPTGSPDVRSAIRIETAFLNDIAHSAAPTVTAATPTSRAALKPDADTTAGGSLDSPSPAGSYDDELLNLHAICGDGRCNENIALQAVHQIFHSEHDRLIGNIQGTLDANPTLKAAFEAVHGAPTVAGPVVTNASLTGNVATLTFAAPPGFAIGDAIEVTGVDATFNGSFVVTAVSGNTISYSLTHADVATAAAVGNVSFAKTFSRGERLFQAARFVTEMQYQHLVFEEFARKVQPAINPFEPFAFNQTDVDPAITAEFAHAVYRFGHSMLTDSIPRLNADGSVAACDGSGDGPNVVKNNHTCLSNDIELFSGFLNPAAYYDGGPAGPLSSGEAAGSIIMGLADQTGQEIDEFVADTLRNRLLGLPLDLPALNMTRARSEGIPPLNIVRKQLHAQTNDGQLAPYTDWVDWGLSLKHPESLVNFVAAYGRHLSIMGDPDGPGPLVAGSLEARRVAADQIVNGTVLPGPDGALANIPEGADFACTSANVPVNCNESLDNIVVPAVPEAPGPDGQLTNLPDLVPLAVACDPLPLVDSPVGCDESLDNLPGTPASVLPGPDGVLVNIPDGGACTAANVPTNCDESVDNFNPPADSADFMFSTGTWADVGGVSVTGVDNIDLWVGGLAEHTNLFGGLLGSTFNYVFENQLTNLQNGDRFYYLARTPGMNLRTQLEGNSFSELVMRNTNAHTLKADPFATADCKFELSRITFPAASGSFITGAGSVADDLVSECNENRLLVNSPTWDVRYRLTNSVDPAGINGQAVYNGDDRNNKIFAGADNDTIWGGKGNDIIEGGDGADIPLGGEGNDIITDSAGDDVLKGGPGNDALDGGIGLDILMGGEGKDFTNGGANSNETFAGAGDDFSIGGQGADAVFGDSGDDWEEGGDQPDLLIGDSSSLFFDDHNLPGHDVMIGQGGDDDYDMEGGDDIGVGGPGVEKNAGASGWDWVIGQGDPQPQDQDLDLPILNAPPVNETRDRFNEVEALSGWNFNDVLRGDDFIPSQQGGLGFIGCDALDQNGLDRLPGLDAIVPPLNVPAATVAANSATNYCLLTGNVWGDGNILLGGAGSDTLEGRGANDILDGDRYLSVRLAIHANPDGTGAEIATTTLMENVPTGPGWTGPLAGKTLQQAVFAGLVDPGQIVLVREVLTAPADSSIDVAQFSGPSTEYTVTSNPDGSVTVVHTTPGAVDDGTDILWNIEQLSFCTTPGTVRGTCSVRQAPIPVGAQAVLSPLSASTLDFGTVRTGATSAAKPITITNTGITGLNIGAPTVTGSAASAFVIANGCTATVVTNAACIITVAFAPTAGGAQSATLTVPHSGPGSPATFSLTGTAATNSVPVGLPVITNAAGNPAILNIAPQEVSSPVILANRLTANTAGISDPDGLGPFSYQWQQNGVGGTGAFADIVGATGSTLDPLAANVDHQLRVIVRYTDGNGSPETVTSNPTDVVGRVFTGGAGVDSPTLTNGRDLASGGAGADNLTGKGGNDTLNGDGGDDTFFYSGVNEGFDTVNGGGNTTAAGDTIRAQAANTVVGLASVANVESFNTGGFAGVSVVGSADANILNFGAITLTGTVVSIDGGDGADNITGFAGAVPDTINGGNGNDTLDGNGGNDTLNGGRGDDTLVGGAGDDTFTYSGVDGGFDAITGGASTTGDSIRALSSNTVIGVTSVATVELLNTGGFAGVIISGNAGNNVLNFGTITLTGVIVSINGGGGADNITGFAGAVPDTINGGAGNDTIAGGAGADVLNGDADDDTITGGADNDTLTGGAGNDTMNGNAGANTFVFQTGFGNDTITGFDANPAGGQDLLDIRTIVTAANFANQVTVAGNGGNARVTVKDANGTIVGTIVLNATAAAAVTAQDFILG